MRQLLFLLFFLSQALFGFSQADTARYIFMGHPRDDDREHEYLLKTIEKIDYTKFDLLLLGGDLTWNTSADRATLQYCDSIFHLGDSKTHLAAGNHDLSNVTDLLEFTKKPRFYAFSRNNITFLILDTDITTPDFKGEQLEMIQNVTDTIEKSDYLVLIHHRIIWMVGVPELAYLMDSVAASTKNLSHSDFYADVYPLLQKVKNKGIQVLCLAGDRTDVNIRYIPEDSVTFLASGMRGTAPDEENFAVILTHQIQTGILDWAFVALDAIDTVSAGPVQTFQKTGSLSEEINIYPNPSVGIFRIYLNANATDNMLVKVFDLSGLKIPATIYLIKKDYFEIDLSDFPPGVYLVQLRTSQAIISKKIIKLE
jgi:hypothetical protein